MPLLVIIVVMVIAINNSNGFMPCVDEVYDIAELPFSHVCAGITLDNCTLKFEFSVKQIVAFTRPQEK